MSSGTFRSAVAISAECEKLINHQINLELAASYAYEQMALYCLRPDIALDNFAEHFQKEAHEERKHAQKFMELLVVKRDGRFEAQPIGNLVDYAKFDGIVSLFEFAHALETDVYKAILQLSECAGKNKDRHLEIFIDEFISHQVQAISEIAKTITRVKNVREHRGQYGLENLAI